MTPVQRRKLLRRLERGYPISYLLGLELDDVVVIRTTVADERRREANRRRMERVHAAAQRASAQRPQTA